LIADGGRALSRVSLLTEKERRQLLSEWNDTRAEFPHDICIHQLFEAQVERTPDNVAVVYGKGETLTYRELNERANRLAHYLKARGVGAESLVGLCVERSSEMAVGMLGALKAGAAYVPLDSTYPQERLAFMLADAGASVLLTQERLLERIPAHAAQIIRLDTDWAEVEKESGANPSNSACTENLAYVIYTSGSTGRPKGALITHRSLVNYADEMTRQFGLRADDRILQFASPGFDVVVEEVFPAWLCGACVVLPEEELLFSCEDLMRVIERDGVTGCELPAAYWQEWVHKLDAEGSAPPASLRFILVGCERPTPESLVIWDRFGIPLIYVYGITETTVTSTLYKRDAPTDTADRRNELPIGRPVANTRIYILAADMQPVPVGVRGELYIAGEGLARGYLHRADLTAQKFVPHPFSFEGGERLYRTGDVARFLPDGNIEFLGRQDKQVKVRGYRIELGEIEAALAEHEGVRECVALVRDWGAGEKRIVAYVIAAQTSLPPTALDLRTFLQPSLPPYMIPAAFILMDEWPLTPNGKVDTGALPAPDAGRPETAGAYVAPRIPIEETLAEIWQEVLGIERVGVYDDFFELGGHSLLAMRLISRLREAFDVELPLRSILDTPNVAGLAIVVVQGQAADLDADEMTRLLAEMEEDAEANLSL
jgi:amino acid adenylation domain-containing protein